jgi:hypothetical protein
VRLIRAKDFRRAAFFHVGGYDKLDRVYKDMVKSRSKPAMFHDHADDSVPLMAPRIIRTSAGGDATAKHAAAGADPKRARKHRKSAAGQPLHPWMPVLPQDSELYDIAAVKQQAELEILKRSSLEFNKWISIQEDTDAWVATTATLYKLNLEGNLNIDTVGMNNAFVGPVVIALESILRILRILSELAGLKHTEEEVSTKMSHDRAVLELATKSREGYKGLLVFLAKMGEAATRFTNTLITFNKIGDQVSENEIMYAVFESDYIDLIQSLNEFTKTAAGPAATIGAYDTVQLLTSRFVSVQTKTNKFVEQAADISVWEKALNVTKTKVSATDDVTGINTLRLAIDTYKYARQTGVEWDQTLFGALTSETKTISMKSAKTFIIFANAFDGKKTPRRNDKSIIQTFERYGITVK